MKHSRLVIYLSLFLLAMVIGFSHNAQARMLYLGPNGDDSAPFADGSEFATLARALDSLTAGDTLYIRNGSYEGGPLVTFSGTADAPIVIKGQSLAAIIDTSNRDNRDNLRLDHCSYVVIDGITVRRSSRAGLGVIRSDHITVRDCVFADNYKWGLFTGFANDVLFENNESYGARDEHGIYHSNSGDRFIIRGNHLHHNRANGLHLNGDPELMSEPGDDGTLNYGIVEGNIIHDNGYGGGAGINMTHVHDIICRNNLIYNNEAGGFTFYADTDDERYTSRRAVLMHNTVYFKSNHGRAVINIQSTSSSMVIADNILVSGGREPVLQAWAGSSSDIISDHNLFWGVDSTEAVTVSDRLTYSLGQWRDNRDNDLNSIYADPLFVSVPDSNFALADSSPAIDFAIGLDSVRAMVTRLDTADWLLGRLDSMVYDDLNGNPRPGGNAPDLGAIEFGVDAQSLYDFNGDGRFTVADALTLLVRASRNPDVAQYDVNGDGAWNREDVIALLRLLLDNSSLLAANYANQRFY